MMETQTQTRSINYRDSLPGAPKPIYARESFDEAMYNEITAAAHNDTTLITSTKQPTVVEMKLEQKHQQQQPLAAPALPQKSSLRSSRVLDAMTLKLDAPGVNEPELARTAAPHEVYLSSEEDGSSSADDFSDYDFDSESEMDPANATTATRKRSYEDIAKMVSVVYSGKPTVVQITTTKRSATPSSSSSSSSSPSSTPSSAAVSRMSSPNLGRRQSSYTQSYYHHPPRTTSLALEGFTLHANSSQPAFLGIDPFADVTPEEAEAGHTSASGRSPSAVFKKTLGLVKKRSRPLLVTTLGNSSQARLDLASPSSSVRDNANESRPETPVTPLTPGARTSTVPVTYHEIMKTAKRNVSLAEQASQNPSHAPPASSISPEKRNRLLAGLSMSRRRSVKAG